MASSSDDEVLIDFSPIIKIKVYKDGRVERLEGCEFVPPSVDPRTNVESKDVLISENDDVSARIFLPKLTDPNQKLPLLVYFHGGGFCVQTPFSPPYHNFLNTIVSQANAIGVSVHYRRAPEHPVPSLEKSGWKGEVEVMEAKGEGHVFFLSNQNCENALALFNRIASFINQS